MREDNLPYYMLMLNYKASDSWTNVLEDGYIDYIAVTSNGNTIIEEMKTRDRLILESDHYIEHFPISLSKDTMDMLFEYTKLQ